MGEYVVVQYMLSSVFSTIGSNICRIPFVRTCFVRSVNKTPASQSWGSVLGQGKHFKLAGQQMKLDESGVWRFVVGFKDSGNILLVCCSALNGAKGLVSALHHCFRHGFCRRLDV